jgi:hypothetical protein
VIIFPVPKNKRCNLPAFFGRFTRWPPLQHPLPSQTGRDEGKEGGGNGAYLELRGDGVLLAGGGDDGDAGGGGGAGEGVGVVRGEPGVVVERQPGALHSVGSVPVGDLCAWIEMWRTMAAYMRGGVDGLGARADSGGTVAAGAAVQARAAASIFGARVPHLRRNRRRKQHSGDGGQEEQTGSGGRHGNGCEETLLSQLLVVGHLGRDAEDEEERWLAD